MIQDDSSDEILKMKLDIVRAGKDAVKELIKIAEAQILGKEPEIDEEGKPISRDIAADRLKNAAATKKLAIFDALEILEKVESTQTEIREMQMGGNGKSMDDLIGSHAK
jgi:hypothetical protein